MLKTLNMKLMVGFGFMALLAAVCGGAGLYGVNSLSNSLDFITGKAWDAADGAMETTIGSQGEMLNVLNTLSDNNASQTSRHDMEEAEAFTKQACDRMLACGLLSDAERSGVTTKYREFSEARKTLLTQYQAFADLNDKLKTSFDSFQQFMVIVEDFGDSRVERLEKAPDMAVTWGGGLEEDWNAADGAMEVQIHLLERYYYYERLTANIDPVESAAKLETALTQLETRLKDVVALKAFAEKVPDGPYAGAVYADVMKKLMVEHKAGFTSAVAALKTYRDARVIYNTAALNLKGYMKEIEEVGDSKVEGETQHLASVKTFSWAMIVIALVLTVITTMAAAWLTYSRLTQPLTEIVRTTTDAAGEFTASASQMAEAGQKLAASASEQASTIEETASALEELSTSTAQNAEHARQARNLASDARKSADGGGTAVAEMSHAMSEIKKASDEVGKIIKVIEEIAFQTNILSLNAAVEAARAGEAGRGFAVVAEEVRNLAKRCATATQDSAARIEAALKSTEVGVQTGQRVSAALADINTAIRNVNALVEQIAAASEQQARGIEQVNTAMLQADKVVQENAANSEETAATAEEISAQSRALQATADQLAGLVGVIAQEKPSRKPPASKHGLIGAGSYSHG